MNRKASFGVHTRDHVQYDLLSFSHLPPPIPHYFSLKFTRLSLTFFFLFRGKVFSVPHKHAAGVDIARLKNQFFDVLRAPGGKLPRSLSVTSILFKSNFSISAAGSFLAIPTKLRGLVNLPAS